MQDKISKLLVKISITIIIITIGIKYPSLEFKHEKSLKTVIKQHFASNAIQKIPETWSQQWKTVQYKYCAK